MKKIAKSIVALLMIVAYSVNSQTQDNQNLLNDASNSKSKFVSNQDYLSTSSLKDYKSFYGDSLKGFDEAYYRNEYLGRALYGAEFIYAMNAQKRYYIKTKYNLVSTGSPVAIPQNPTNASPKPIGGGGNVVNVLPCVNEDFEATAPGAYSTATAVTGWTVESGMNTSIVIPPNVQYGAGCVANPIAAWNPGSPEFSIVTTPIFQNIVGAFSIDHVNVPNSPLGGTHVARLNDKNPTGLMTRISTAFPVTNANTLFQFAYAGSWDGVHECCGQPAFRIDMYQCSGPGSLTPVPLPCANVSLTPSGAQCISGVPGYSVTSGVSWTNWVVKYIDLTPYIGQCIKMVITCSDCSYTGHHGTAYFDARCGGQLVGSGLGGVGGSVPGAVSFCAGSNQAIISSPIGYQSYQWLAPGGFVIPAPLGTAPSLTVNSPVPGSVYTVQATSPSGCMYLITNTINFSQVNIAGIGSNPTCPNGASGSATVQGNGSGTGYNYNWLNSASVTVGTASVVSGLAAGVYSIVLTGVGAAGCGSAVTTVTIGSAIPGIINVYKPYCNNEAYLFAGPGSNFKWYNGNTPVPTLIPPPAGVQSSFTVTNPSPANGAVYWLSYFSSTGCQDSVKFTLGLSAPGAMNVSQIRLVCPGGSNGSAVVSMISAPGAPPGQSSYSVFSTGTTPTYTAALFPTALTTFTPTGLSAGSYSVSSFDGSCRYGTSFNVQALTYDYTLSPVPSTLCPGNSIAAGITFSVPPSATQYSYQWTPSTWLAGNTQQSTIISPATPLGSVTCITYTVVVTPTIANCPISKTLNICAANPAPPVITPIPALCDNMAPYQVLVAPTGGTFAAANTTVLGTTSGILSPNFAPSLGTHTLSYAYSVYTCVATSTTTYQVSHFNTSALTSAVPPLCVTNQAFNLMNIVQSSANGSWSGALGGVTPTNFFNPSGLPTGLYPISYNTTSNPNPTVCPSSTTLNVAVTMTTTPYITPKSEFCNNASAFNMTVSPSGGGWVGNGVNTFGVVTPSLFANAGNFPISYTVADGPCINFNQTTLIVSRFNTASLTASIPYLCATNNPFNLLSICQQTAGFWTGPQVSNNILNPAGFPVGSNVNTYTYTNPSFPTAGLCDDTRTITANVLNPPAPNIAQVGPFCNNGGPFQLSVSPNTGSWSPSPYLTSTGLFTPSLCPVGSNIVQYIIGTNTCNTAQTKQISIEAFVSAALTSPVPDQCNTSSPVNLQAISQNNLGSWSGPGIQGFNFNPANTGSGNFVLIYNTVSSPSGLCPDQSTVAVTVYSLATPAVTKMGPYCNASSPVQIQVNPAGGFFGGPGVNLEGLFNPPLGVIGDNVINYSITSGPCVAYAQTTITLEEFVSADFAKQVGPFCRNADAVNLDGFVQNPGGMWVGAGVQGNMFSPNLANIGTNNIITYQTHSYPTATLCPDISTVAIQVNVMPEVKVVSNLYKDCAPFEVRLNMTNANSGSGVWNFGDGSETQSGLTTSYVYTNPGTYTVEFSYEDEIGCKGQTRLPTPIVVWELPSADFAAPLEVLISNPEVKFTNLSTVLENNKYNWNFGSFGVSSEINPTKKFDKVGRYPVTLQALTVNGCKHEITRTIEVKNDFNIYIPSSFTPNKDGLNDYFIPVFSPEGLDAKTYELEVFDRWGHSMFYTKDVTKGWDGSVLNKGDEELKEEVFIYRIKYKDVDGNVYNKMGHVTLLK